MPTGRLLNSVAALVILDVVAVYGACLSLKGTYPPSHPWSGITLVLLSLRLIPGLLGRHRLNPSSPGVWLYSGGVVLSAGLWTVAAILTP
jgi:hypothetical protein